MSSRLHTSLLLLILALAATVPAARNLAGSTALHIAAKLGQEAGARLDAKNLQGETAWDVAKKLGRTELLPLLRPESSP